MFIPILPTPPPRHLASLKLRAGAVGGIKGELRNRKSPPFPMGILFCLCVCLVTVYHLLFTQGVKTPCPLFNIRNECMSRVDFCHVSDIALVILFIWFEVVFEVLECRDTTTDDDI